MTYIKFADDWLTIYIDFDFELDIVGHALD